MRSAYFVRPVAFALVAIGVLALACVGGPGDGSTSSGSSSGGSSSGTSGASSSTSSSGTSGASTSGASGTPVTPPKKSDYASDCKLPSDCVVVQFGSDPCCGGCDTAAISTKDKARFDSDSQKFRASCSSTAPCAGAACSLAEATCSSSGKCIVCSPKCGDAG